MILTWSRKYRYVENGFLIRTLFNRTVVGDFSDFFFFFFFLICVCGVGGALFPLQPKLDGDICEAGEEGAMTPQSTADISAAHVCGFRSLFHCFTRNSHVQIEKRRGGAGRGLIWSFHLSGHWESKSKRACGFTQQRVQCLQAIHPVAGCPCWCPVGAFIFLSQI